MTLTERKAVARLLRKAAKLMLNASNAPAGMCMAVTTAANFDVQTRITANLILMSLYRLDSPLYSDSYWFAPAGTEYDARTIALLFAAEVVAHGELP